MLVRFILIVLLFFGLLINYAIGQRTNISEKYLIAKLGKGICYGGYGINMEFRNKHLGYYIGYGYAPSFTMSNVKVKQSWNLAFGTVYHFFDNNSSFKPFVGIHFGWLNNYYHEKIKQNYYNPVVYGFAFRAGLEFKEDIMHFKFSVDYDPGFAIVSKAEHPYYANNMRFSTSLGFGIDLFNTRSVKIFKSKGKKTDGKILDNESFGASDTIVELNNEKAEQIKPIITDVLSDKCFSYTKHSQMGIIPKGSCGDLNVYQQIGSDLFIFVSIDNSLTELQNFNSSFIIDSLGKRSMKAFLVKKTSFSFADCETASRQFDAKDFFLAKEGQITISIKEAEDSEENFTSKISIKINNAKFSRTINNVNEELYFDEILICNLKF
jgi:hypothetical protein